MLKGLFIDLSGVLYEGDRAMPGAVEAVQRLQQSDMTLRFVTNTSRRNRQQLLDDLYRLGFELAPEQLISAPVAAARWLQAHGKRPFLLIHPDILCEFEGLETQQPDAVVIGDAEQELNYQNLNQAFRLLMDGAELIAIGYNRYFKLGGQFHLDAGPFVRALEYAADCKAIVTGKPAAAFFQQALDDCGLKANEVMMLGDDIHGDIEGARNAGLHACLVRSGKYRPGDEDRIDTDFEVMDSLADWVNQRL
ncbi:MAG TPA: TIGR01458 family HAD-type hydrolase [Gammaproteobacteria bacterium]|nr:TIGR01458 family HAD-type hydrolase [Gammaproteobacteria bacterium]